MRTRFHLPEPGLSRAARWCLGGSFFLILAFAFGAGIWQPAWRVYEVVGANPRIDPPVSTMAEWDSHDPEDWMIVALSRDTRPWRRGKLLDANGLDDAFRDAIRDHDSRCRHMGRTSTDEIVPEQRVAGFHRILASRLVLALRVDREAPWGAVHDLLRRAGAAGLYRIAFLARPPEAWHSKWLWVFLPRTDEPSAAIAIGVRLGPRGSTVYSLAGDDAPDPAAFRDRLLALYKQAYDSEPSRLVAARIAATRDVPFEAVVRALDELIFVNLGRVDLEAAGVRADVR